ncbi:MAG: GNAT family N-acetyltransferase [Eubacteriales bacterium]
MKNLILIKPSKEYLKEIRDYRNEFFDFNSSFAGDSGLRKFEDINEWIEHCRLMENKETVPNSNLVEGEQFMLVHEGENRILGMINFRHYLNDHLAEIGGHIGYCVRPSERGKGYAKTMLSLCLNQCREFGLEKILLTCDENNVASKRTILACGGVFEITAIHDEKAVERYWIALLHTPKPPRNTQN